MTLSLTCTSSRSEWPSPPLHLFRNGARLHDPEDDPLLQLWRLTPGDSEASAQIPAFEARTVSASSWSFDTGWRRHPATSRAAALLAGGAIALAPLAAGAEELSPTPPTTVSSETAPELGDPALGQHSTLELQWAEPSMPGRQQSSRSAESDDYPPPDGAALGVPGAILTGAGIAFLSAFGISGAINPYAAIHGSFNYYTYSYGAPTFPLAIIGGALLGPGIPLLAAGSAKQQKRRRWFERKKWENKVSVAAGPTQRGWYGRLQIKF